MNLLSALSVFGRSEPTYKKGGRTLEEEEPTGLHQQRLPVNPIDRSLLLSAYPNTLSEIDARVALNGDGKAEKKRLEARLSAVIRLRSSYRPTLTVGFISSSLVQRT